MQPTSSSHIGNNGILVMCLVPVGSSFNSASPPLKSLRHFTKSNQKDQESKKEPWGPGNSASLVLCSLFLGRFVSV